MRSDVSQLSPEDVLEFARRICEGARRPEARDHEVMGCLGGCLVMPEEGS